ncbi:MAG: hypothetical protein B7Z34_04200 [Novosphingobium sp. 12-62-10]|nr:MAG: hypothetical protein B7Z34_04200 [Novosphingobium sp. 12-62-10]
MSAIDDGKQSAITIVDAAEASCFPKWLAVSTFANEAARKAVARAEGDPRVSEKMIRSFGDDVQQLKLLVHNQSLALLLEKRKSNVPIQ